MSMDRFTSITHTQGCDNKFFCRTRGNVRMGLERERNWTLMQDHEEQTLSLWSDSCRKDKKYRIQEFIHKEEALEAFCE